MGFSKKTPAPAKAAPPDSSGSGRLRKARDCFCLTALGVLLFAAIFPNPVIQNGVPFLAWFAYIPVFLIIRRVRLAASVFWGALYGFSAYGLFNFWLAAFHPMAWITACLVFLVYFALVFPLLKLCAVLFPRRGYLVQWLVWLAFEYLRTQGFLGYSYGITGYSQWKMLPLLPAAGLGGVWVISALAVFPSAWLGAALSDVDPRPADRRLRDGFTGMPGAVRDFFRKEKIPALVWTAALAAALIFGFVQERDFSAYPQARIALVQHNVDPWKGGLDEYRRNLAVLRRLSDEALAAEPAPDMVVWPETAIVPRIYWHQTYRGDPPTWVLIKELLDYLAAQDAPFVIGNDDARKEPAKNPSAEEDYRVDYNAALYFEKRNISGLYRKMRLVPFSEHFPYKKQFPGIYRALQKADTHFWEPGGEAVVFSGPGFTFSTPICFEDTFGYLSRDFVKKGAEVLVNLSNDAWSKSLAAQNQHLAMAVFRAAENRRSVVRSTATGQTCAIDPLGRITAEAPPFREAQITVAIPLVKGHTVYTRYGDFLGRGFTALAFFLLILGGAGCILKKLKTGRYQ